MAMSVVWAVCLGSPARSGNSGDRNGGGGVWVGVECLPRYSPLPGRPPWRPLRTWGWHRRLAEIGGCHRVVWHALALAHVCADTHVHTRVNKGALVARV